MDLERLAGLALPTEGSSEKRHQRRCGGRRICQKLFDAEAERQFAAKRILLAAAQRNIGWSADFAIVMADLCRQSIPSQEVVGDACQRLQHYHGCCGL